MADMVEIYVPFLGSGGWKFVSLSLRRHRKEPRHGHKPTAGIDFQKRM